MKKIIIYISTFTLLFLCCKKEKDCMFNGDETSSIEEIIWFENDSILDSISANGEGQYPIKASIFRCADENISVITFKTQFGSFVAGSDNGKTLVADLLSDNSTSVVYIPPLNDSLDQIERITATVTNTDGKNFTIEKQFELIHYDPDGIIYTVMFLGPDNSSHIADGEDQAIVTLKITPNPFRIINNENAFFSIIGGTFADGSSSKTVNIINNQASEIINSTIVGTAIVSASYEDSLDEQYIIFTEVDTTPPPPPIIDFNFVTLPSNVLDADNYSEILLQIVIDSEDIDLTGEEVSLYTSRGTFSNDLNTKEVLITGPIVSEYIKSNEIGPGIIDATYSIGGYSDAISTAVDFIKAEPDILNVSVSNSSIGIDTISGTPDIQITATPIRSNGDISSNCNYNIYFAVETDIPLPPGQDLLFGNNSCFSSDGSPCTVNLINPQNLTGLFDIKAYFVTNDTVVRGGTSIIYLD